MAQLDAPRRYVKTSTHHGNDLTVEQLLYGDDARWSAPTTPSFGKNHDQEEDLDHQTKKSVLTKVKEKAKKWRHTLVKKKHAHDNNPTPAWGVSLDDDDEDEEDPEYYGAPMYESELAPEGYKEMARQNPRAVPVISEKHVLVTSVSPLKEEKPSKTITESVTEKLAPAYAIASETTHMIASKIQGAAVGTSMASISCSEHKWDKGVSVKEYLMQKLEPGEEERALSQVISEAISPRQVPGNMGVVGKMREAVTSFLGVEESSSTSLSMKSNMSTNIPVSTNVHQAIEEENGGRRLQTN